MPGHVGTRAVVNPTLLICNPSVPFVDRLAVVGVSAAICPSLLGLLVFIVGAPGVDASHLRCDAVDAPPLLEYPSQLRSQCGQRTCVKVQLPDRVPVVMVS